MTLIAAVHASSNLLAHLANAAIRALALAGAGGLGLAAFRVKATSVRLFTWSGVLYAALAMPLLGLLLPPLPIPTPAFLQYAVSHNAVARSVPKDEQGARPLAANPVRSEAGEVLLALNGAAKGASSIEIIRQTLSPSPVGQPLRKQIPLVAPAPAPSPSFRSSIRWDSIRWSAVATGIYLAIASLLVLRFFVGLALGRRLIRASQRIEEPHVNQKLCCRAYALGLGFVPQAAESEFISVPVTMGAPRSTILLPCGWRAWDDAKLDAVIAHEVSHIARRDALTQRLSLLHRAIFWFSPLAWWLDRHLADLAEQASDEAALACGADSADYARILLGFFEALQTAPGRVWWQGVSMAKAGQAEQRVERVLSWKGSVAMRLKKSIAVLVVTVAVPVVYLAASAHPASYAAEPQPSRFLQSQTAAPRSAAAPEAEPGATPEPAPTSKMTPPLEQAAPSQAQPGLAPTAITGTVSGKIYRAPAFPPAQVAARIAAHAYPPTSAVALLAAIPSPAPGSGQAKGSGSSSGGSSYHTGYDDEQRFVIASGNTDSLTMSGTSEDARHVEKLKKSIQGDFIWFERDEKSYIIRDQVTIDRARKLWAPQEELGKKQEALGKQQEALGKQQEELGSKMEQIKVNVPDMTAELDKLKAELKQLNSSATVEQIGHIQSEIGELQSRIGELQSQAGQRQAELGTLQGALGSKQGKLGEQQGELGRQQAELAQKAARQMKELLDEAIARGTAQPEL
jgi:beta-lactamase regulating signal transducer with metallopeptidase domain